MNYKNLTIKNARFYQAVVINDVMSTYIINPEYVAGRVEEKKNVKLKMCDEGLLIESEKEMTIVSWNNLAALTLDKKSSTQEASAEPEQLKTSEDIEAKIKSKSKKTEPVDWKKI